MASTIFYAGTSGLALPVRNKSMFPPAYQDKSRLTYYASLFNSIEINSSFYKLPMAKTVAKWSAEVLGNFLFTYKLWRNITHNKQLAFDPGDVKRFITVINAAGEKKGCLLIQFPASITIAARVQLEHLLNEIVAFDADRTWKIAIEFRHSSWYNEEIYRLLDNYQAGLVIHDMPASATPMEVLNADFVYLRFHGPGGRYGGSYADDFLSEYATYIREWQQEGKTVFVYFNNTMGDAVGNLATLMEMVNK